MTEYKKRYINLWVKEDKNGLLMLSGTDKSTGVRYFVFTDKEDSTIKRLVMSAGDSLVTIGQLEKATSDYGDYLRFKNYIISDNKFYNEADPFLKNKSDSYILNAKGEKIPAPEYTLSISEKKDV